VNGNSLPEHPRFEVTRIVDRGTILEKCESLARKPNGAYRERRMLISSRTPEGTPNLCPVCGTHLKIEPSLPPGDAPCPACGHLLWFAGEAREEFRTIEMEGRLDRPESFDRLSEPDPMPPGTRRELDFSSVVSRASSMLAKLIGR
jgi:hypothetical protein